jgi:4-amino-4-deoxy-L-arabinose transferase-like glycosyltransferase
LKKLPENIGWAFAFLLVVLAWFFGLLTDVTGDSGLYSAITRQMVESGNWFNLKINGEPYDQKPHLFFWLAGIGVQLFGNSNFAFKLFPFLYGVAGIYFTYRLGKQLFSEEAGKWAALITGTSQIYFLYFLDFHTDSVLQTGVILALWQLAAYLQHKKLVNFIFGFIGVGLAMLSKGPVGAVLPFFAVLLYLVFKKDFKQLFHPKWFLGILISLFVISPTLVHLYQSFGLGGIKFFFITNNFGRISGSYAGSSTDYFYYVYNALWAFLPWTVFVLFALFSEIKSWFNPEIKNVWGIYLLGSVLILFFILSIAKGKAPNYFLIAVAPVAVLTGKWMEEIKNLFLPKRKILYRSHRFLMAVLVLLLFALFFFLSAAKSWVFLFFLIFFGLFLFGAFRKFENISFKNLLLHTTVIAGSLNLFLNAGVIPGLFEYQGARQVLKIYEAENRPGTQLYNFELEEYGLFFYSRKTVENVDDWDEFYRIMDKPGTWLYTNEIKYRDILSMSYNIDTVYQISQRGMNSISLQFINPKTREQSLKTNYLIVTGGAVIE